MPPSLFVQLTEYADVTCDVMWEESKMGMLESTVYNDNSKMRRAQTALVGVCKMRRVIGCVYCKCAKLNC